MKVLKHGGNMGEQPKIEHIEEYKLTCSQCRCEFIAGWREASSIENTITNPKMTFTCPECGASIKIERMGNNLYEFRSEESLNDTLKTII